MCYIAPNKDLARKRYLTPEHPRRCRHCTQMALLTRLGGRHSCQDVLLGDWEPNTEIKVKNVLKKKRHCRRRTFLQGEKKTITCW